MPLRMSDAVPEKEDTREGQAESVVAEESAPSVEIRAEHHSAELHFYAHGSTAEAIEALERIDTLDPSGMAVRLLESMLEDSEHRRESARTEASRRHALAIRGQLGALLMALSGLTFGFVLAVLGRPLWGFGWTASVLVPIVGMSIAERRSQRRRQDQQRPGTDLERRHDAQSPDNTD